MDKILMRFIRCACTIYIYQYILYTRIPLSVSYDVRQRKMVRPNIVLLPIFIVLLLKLRGKFYFCMLFAMTICDGMQ